MIRRGGSLLLVLVALALTGCGLGAGRQIEGDETVDVQVTRRLEGDQLVWTYGPMFTARLERVG